MLDIKKTALELRVNEIIHKAENVLDLIVTVEQHEGQPPIVRYCITEEIVPDKWDE